MNIIFWKVRERRKRRYDFINKSSERNNPEKASTSAEGESDGDETNEEFRTLTTETEMDDGDVIKNTSFAGRLLFQ